MRTDLGQGAAKFIKSRYLRREAELAEVRELGTSFSGK